jgi:hypothetical protein
LDGDDRKDILLINRGGVTVFDQDGSILLSLLVAENQTEPRAKLVDLDGKPGDELVVNIPGYGLVALGRNSSQGKEVAASPSKRSP